MTSSRQYNGDVTNALTDYSRIIFMLLYVNVHAVGRQPEAFFVYSLRVYTHRDSVRLNLLGVFVILYNYYALFESDCPKPKILEQPIVNFPPLLSLFLPFLFLFVIVFLKLAFKH